MGESCWPQAKRRHQHAHHDGTQPEERALNRGFFNGVAGSGRSVDLLQHDDADL
jgi:ribosome modulation factor